MTTSETVTILSPKLIADLMTIAIEEKPSWWFRIEMLSGLNEIKPFYCCKKFWASPFKLLCTVKDRTVEVGQQELGNGLAILENKRPGSILRIARGDYTHKDADAFAQAVILGDILYE